MVVEEINSLSNKTHICLYCQSFCDHDSLWCPERKCKKCGQKGHVKVYCMKNMENMPLSDEIVLKIFTQFYHHY